VVEGLPHERRAGTDMPVQGDALPELDEGRRLREGEEGQKDPRQRGSAPALAGRTSDGRYREDRGEGQSRKEEPCAGEGCYVACPLTLPGGSGCVVGV
jgi:hypothetical protein